MKLSVNVTNYSWPAPIRDPLATRRARWARRALYSLGKLGIQHVVVIARGRPFRDDDLRAVAAAATQTTSAGV